MRGNTCVRGMVVLGVAIGGYLSPAAVTGELFGVSLARAEKFYTRKRVNGQWITGLFPAEDTAPTRPRRRPRVVARARAAPAPQLAVAAIPPATPEAFRQAPVTPAAEPVAFPLSETAQPAAVASAAPDGVRRPESRLPEPSAQPLAVASASGDKVPKPAPSSVIESLPSSEDYLARLRMALMARAQEIAATSSAPVSAAFASAVVTPPAPVGADTRVVPSVPDAAADAKPAEPAKVAARLEPRSVSYDFETGVKTTVFANSIVREPFDIPSVKRIALPTR